MLTAVTRLFFAQTMKLLPKGATFGLLLLCLTFGPLLACGAKKVQPYPWTSDWGKSVDLGAGLAFSLPEHFHEVASSSGRTFRVRGGPRPSFSAVTVQYRLSGTAALLDTALTQVMEELSQQQNFDLFDIQLFYVGDALALGYTAQFDNLEVLQRQLGVLLSTDQGLVAVMLTSPETDVAQAIPDFIDILASLSH